MGESVWDRHVSLEKKICLNQQPSSISYEKTEATMRMLQSQWLLVQLWWNIHAVHRQIHPIINVDEQPSTGSGLSPQANCDLGRTFSHSNSIESTKPAAWIIFSIKLTNQTSHPEYPASRAGQGWTHAAKLPTQLSWYDRTIQTRSWLLVRSP